MSLAYVFPGQGSQSLQMLNDLANEYDEVITTFKEASDVLGYDLWDVVQNGPEEKLNSTDITQPAMLASGVAVWRVLEKCNVTRPDVVAGHSLGEYSALVCAGSIQFTDAIKLVAERGRLMQAAVPEGSGAMAAILGMTDADVIKACEDAANGEVVEAVNFNSPGQVVIAGTKSAVQRVVELSKERGAKMAVILPVSVPSHCALMKPAAEKLATTLEAIDIKTPQISVINNVDVSMETDAAAIRKALVMQLYSPVRWVETIEKMKSMGVERLIECGPGKVLVGLNKRIDRKMPSQAIYDAATVQQFLAD